MSTSPSIAALRSIAMLLVFLAATGVRGGQTGVPPRLAPAYERLRDAVYQNVPIIDIRDLYKKADSLRRAAIGNKSDNAYWSARIEYLAGRAETELRNWKEADSVAAPQSDRGDRGTPLPGRVRGPKRCKKGKGRAHEGKDKRGDTGGD